MGRSFNFLPFNRPVANAPVENFASSMGLRLEQYNKGETLTDVAKETFGTLDVALDDQDRKNEFAQQLSDDLDGLLDQYDGAYESLKFQRDAKKLIVNAASHPMLKAMENTLAENNYEQEIRREASKKGLMHYDFSNQEFKGTQYTEGGGFVPYQSGFEIALNHLADAREFIGKFTPDASSFNPKIHGVEGHPMGTIYSFAQGQSTSVGEPEVVERAERMVDGFAESANGGNQLARKLAQELGVSYRDENGELDSKVKHGLYKYLYDVGMENEFHQSKWNYSIPAGLNKASEEIYAPEEPIIGNTSVRNNPASSRLRQLDKDNLTRGLKGSQKSRMDHLTTRKAQATIQEGAGTSPVISGFIPAEPLNTEEQAELKELQLVDQNLRESDSFAAYIYGYFKRDDSGYMVLDSELLNQSHAGLSDVIDGILEDELGFSVSLRDITDPDLSNKAVKALEANEDRIMKQYNGFADKHQTVECKIYTPNEAEREDWSVNTLGESDAGFGQIIHQNVIDKDGKESSLSNILTEKYGVDLTDTKQLTAAKKKIEFVANVLPILNNGYREMTIGGEPYTLVSNEAARMLRDSGLASVAPVLRGETDKSDTVQLSFLNDLEGYFASDHDWDKGDNYTGNGVIFVYIDPNTKEPVWVPVEEIYDHYMNATRINGKGKKR